MYKVAKIEFERIDLQGAAKKEISFPKLQSPSVNTEHNLFLIAPSMEEVRPAKEPPQRAPSLSRVTIKGTSIDQLVSGVTAKMKGKVLDLMTLVSHDLRMDALTVSYCIILQQRVSGRPTREGEEEEKEEVDGAYAMEKSVDQLFLLFNSRAEDEATDAFTKLEAILQPLLSVAGSQLHEDFLRDIIGLTGPVAPKELPRLLVKWMVPNTMTRFAVDVNARYDDGLTALHLACRADQEDVVENLLELGADSTVVDSKGNTPYHLAVSRGYVKGLQVLLDCDAKRWGEEKVRSTLSIQNVDGHTPLMLAAAYNFTQCAFSMVLANADVNAANRATGNTALHIATQKGHLIMAKLLAVFDARIDLLNKRGKTPIEVAEASTEPGAMKCYEEIGALVIENEMQSAEVIPPVVTSPAGPVLLSIDGGGIRGLVANVVLNELENLLRELDPTFASLSEYFDWTVGTSTGCYIICGMVYLKMSPAKMRKLYLQFKEKAKELSRPYPDSAVNACMKQIVPEDIVLSSVTTPRAIFTTTLADRSPPELHLMCNYGEARQGQKGPSERKLWEAARASSAAPTYFEAFENVFIDGGVMSNNPTLDGMSEMVQQLMVEGKPLKIGMVVSLGTGVVPSKRTPGINLQRKAATLVDDLKGLYGLVQVLVAQVTASDGQEVERAQAWCNTLQCPFFRFSAPMKDIDLNESDNERLIEMMFYGLIYVKRNYGKLHRLAELLIEHKAGKHAEDKPV